MNSHIIFDTEDKSVYADILSEWTGRPRSDWAFVPLIVLKRIYQSKLNERNRSRLEGIQRSQRTT